jgi:predicted metal-dependent phosphoesterase TrpH
MRCDLHVHSIHSGPVDLPLLRHVGNECYSQPWDVYEAAVRRGMTLVTLTDHDSIAGALELRGVSNTFVSEEVTCELPAGRQIHLGVFDIDERQHERIQALRRDAEALFAFLAEERIPACANHLFSALTGKREPGDLHRALGGLPLVEALNGMMPRPTNEYALAAGSDRGLRPVGGSDAHTLATVARAYTLVPGARNREEFLAGLRRGLTVPAGRSGGYARLTADVARVFAGGYLEAARDALSGPRAAARLAGMLIALPVLVLIPAFTAGIHLHERLFAARLSRAFASSSPLRFVLPSARPWADAGPLVAS